MLKEGSHRQFWQVVAGKMKKWWRQRKMMLRKHRGCGVRKRADERKKKVTLTESEKVKCAIWKKV